MNDRLDDLGQAIARALPESVADCGVAKGELTITARAADIV